MTRPERDRRSAVEPKTGSRLVVRTPVFAGMTMGDVCYNELMKVEWNRVTWYSKIIALALFVALPFAGLWFGIHYGETEQYATDVFAGLEKASSSMPTASERAGSYYKNVSEWQTDQNNSGWSIAYPVDFDATDNYLPAPTDNWRQENQGGPGLQPFTLTIPRAFEPQTNFAGATLTVGVSSDTAAVAQCLNSEPTGPPSEMPTSTAVINGIDFTVFHLGDAGAGSIYETTSYRTLHAGQCWAIEYTIHSSEIGDYPLEYGLVPFDEIALHDVLDRIVGTFKFE